MEPIRLLSTRESIQWNMPLEKLYVFSGELSCSIPFKMLGSEEICRYVKPFKGIQLFVTPVFYEDKLICLKASFDKGEKIENYNKILETLNSTYQNKVCANKEEWNKFGELSLYPVNIWIEDDSIIELGIHAERFEPVGYLMITYKDSYEAVYTDKYIRTIGWDPKKYI
jgi:hypothetical protein